LEHSVKKIKIAHIVYGLKCGGAEKLIWRIASAADRGRYESVVVTLSMGGPLEETMRASGVPVYFMAKRGRYDLSVLFRLSRFLRREKIDVAHTHLFGGDVWGRTAAAFAGVPLVVSSLQAVDLWLTAPQRALERWTARFAHRLIAASDAVKDFYVSVVGIPEEKISVVCNGVDCSGLPAAVDREEKFRELGIPDRASLVTAACRLEAQKDIPTWLRAASRIAREIPGAEFLIAGEGSRRREMEELSLELGISGSVRFLGLRHDVDEIFSVSDLVMFSSRFEGLSLALLEAMASGKAVIATDIAENRAVITQGQNGVLVAPGNPDALAAAAIRLLGDANERRRLGEAALLTVRDRYDVARCVKAILAIYEEGARNFHGDSNAYHSR
jgi:glycosyltransferase involved in cell wall biosynthesis